MKLQSTRWFSLATLLVVCLPSLPVFGEDRDWVAMSRRVDELLDASDAAAGFTPGPVCTDETFLRRASLDLIGRIPEVSEVRRILEDTRPNRRELHVERLLASPRHATHLATLWRQALLPGGADVRTASQRVVLQNWLRSRFALKTPFDQIVDQLLVAEGTVAASPQASYYVALELKPAELAAHTSRSLLGVQIQCAQCHDHPFDHWQQRDFWGFAAFFARIAPPPRGPRNRAVVQVYPDGEVAIPGSSLAVTPRFPDGSESPDDEGSPRRHRLSQWMRTDGQLMVARAAVNRIWHELFGRGIVEPVDDLGPHNPPSHPQLFDELAEYFVRDGYRMDNLFRVLVNTRAYQRSTGNDAPPQDPTCYSRMAVKSLSGNQLLDSLETAILTSSAGGQPTNFLPQFGSARRRFLALFGEAAGERTDYRAGIPQALSLMNGQLIESATDFRQSRLLKSIQAPFLSDEDQIDALFLATLSRLPDEQERKRFTALLRQAESDSQRRSLQGDMLWALLNSAEFALNH